MEVSDRERSDLSQPLSTYETLFPVAFSEAVGVHDMAHLTEDIIMRVVGLPKVKIFFLFLTLEAVKALWLRTVTCKQKIMSSCLRLHSTTAHVLGSTVPLPGPQPLTP